MRNDNKITIIVPVYNVEKYICRCIESLIKQTYTNIEIILVDDGSIDKSAAICNKFAVKDNRIKVICKQNTGVSDTRNVGLTASTGKYITFVDGDDFLPLDAVEKLYNALLKNNTDMVCGCWCKISAKGTFQNHHPSAVISTKSKDSLMPIMDYEEIKGPVAKIFKTDIIKANDIIFPEDIKISEDTIFVYQYLQRCKDIYFLDENVYYYNRLSIGSATTKYYDKFNISSFMCIEEYVKNVVVNDDDLLNIKLQEKIVKQFELVNKYILFYKSDNKEEAVLKLKETYNLFKDYIKEDVVFNNSDIFGSYIDIIEFLKNYDFEALFEFLIKQNYNINKTDKKTMKNFFIGLLIKIKIFIIFKIKIGYLK